ncbi:hypothetical protein HGRIS_013389 [Hohenbuehelia grisea]|uniref:PHD-type domain-containing protein n=1 Tax=Hohenbuehelia grisea TaxID=104357 RepID=A0ABR3IVG3_9AGAR
MASTASTAVYMMPGVPVVQPPHLEGDTSLATEILPGPPSLSSVQQAALKRDPKKPVFSYLPPVDPGSTYSALMAGTPASSALSVAGVRSKRTRADKGTTGRAQRASARHQNGTTLTQNQPPLSEEEAASGSTLLQAPPYLDDPEITMIVDDDTSISRANSSQNIDGPEPPLAPPNGRGRPRRDKGKAREVESSAVRVKEEPKAVMLQTPEPLYPINNNEDHCSACRSQSSGLVYCDGCPRAFHFWCLDPPAENIDESSKWFCPACTARKNPPRKPPHSLLSPLIHHLATSIPSEFQLPEDYRTYFKDVTTGPRGAYVDASEIKQPRLNRFGQLDERDPYRLKDRNGAPVLCFRCGTSALPTSVAAAAPAAKRTRGSPTTPHAVPSGAVAGPSDGGVAATTEAASSGPGETWKSIVSCDHCNLHWHLDCLDPPLAHMPGFGKKWMCPNHAEQLIPSKRRIPKVNAAPIEVTQTRQFNNGNIEVVLSDTTPFAAPRVDVDEVLINGRRYRVPERVVMLDFWSKVSKDYGYRESTPEDDSGMSSPLTSLSSLDDDLDERPRFSLQSPSEPGLYSADDVRVAQMLCGLHDGLQTRHYAAAAPGTMSRANSMTGTRQASRAIPAPPPVSASASVTPTLSSATPKKRGRPRIIRPPNPITGATSSSAPPKRPVVGANGVTRTLTSDSISTSVSAVGPSLRRRKSTSNIQPTPSTRELRSRTRRDDPGQPSSALSTPAGLANGTDGHLPEDGGKRMTAMEYLRQVGKLPPVPEAPPPMNGIIVKTEDADHSSALLLDALPANGVTSPTKKRRGRLPRSEINPPGTPFTPTEGPRRGRKRKQPADDDEGGPSTATASVVPTTSTQALNEASSISAPAAVPTTKRVRTQKQKATIDGGTEAKAGLSEKAKGKEKDSSSATTPAEKPRRPPGRPRKYPLPVPPSSSAAASGSGASAAPGAGGSHAVAAASTKPVSRVVYGAGASVHEPTTPSTSLKIRLPRMSNVNLGASPQRAAGLGVDTPTSL